MDPVSVLGLAGSIVGIIEVAARSIVALRALQQRWKTADLTINVLISQLTTLKAALSQIKEWISNSLSASQHYQLVMDLGASLASCDTLRLFIDGQLSHLNRNDSNALDFESKIKAVLAKLGKHNRKVFEQVKDDSSSLFCLRDSASSGSSLTATTERSNLLDISFDFDEQLTATKVYHRQWRPLIREALRKGKKMKEDSVNSQKASGNGLAPAISSRRSVDPHAIDVKILALGQKSMRICALLEAMSILCQGFYNPELCRDHIYQVVSSTIIAILENMAELSLPFERLDTETHSQMILSQQASILSAGMSEERGKALVSLWDDAEVKRCYYDSLEGTTHPSATYYLNSIARIMSADFVPNFEDAAMSLVSRGRRFDVLTLPVSLSPRRYKFITWIPARDYLKIPRDAPLMNWPDELEGLDAMIIMVDLAVFTAHGAFLDEFDTLQRFRRVCNSIWLAEKDVILVLLNIDKLSNKSPIVSAHDYKEEESQAQVADTVVNRFLSLNQDESRKIHVIFADNDDSSKNLECFEGAVQQILERKTVAAGNS